MHWKLSNWIEIYCSATHWYSFENRSFDEIQTAEATHTMTVPGLMTLMTTVIGRHWNRLSPAYHWSDRLKFLAKRD